MFHPAMSVLPELAEVFRRVTVDAKAAGAGANLHPKPYTLNPTPLNAFKSLPAKISRREICAKTRQAFARNEPLESPRSPATGPMLLPRELLGARIRGPR